MEPMSSGNLNRRFPVAKSRQSRIFFTSYNMRRKGMFAALYSHKKSRIAPTSM